VAVLAGVVVIRTVISFSLKSELDRHHRMRHAVVPEGAR
jgi:hypothetical protein